MKISYNWLKNYLPNLPTPVKTAELLTGCGLEVENMEKYETVKGGLEGCVVGEVKTKEKHPDADRLSLTTVDIGTGTLLSIVCGASNVAVGQKVVVATVGSTLYPVTGDPITLKKAKIRGALSEGMICAEDELGLGTSHDGIMVLDPTIPTGTPAREYFKIESDHIFEIGLTPNRADAASHIGVARDLAALLGSKVTWPDVSSFSVKEKSPPVSIRIEDKDACPRYSGLCISNVTVGDSPSWLKQRLQAIGLRSINNVVDVTNFVMHETGQPLHAFDADKIAGKEVVVKKLPAKTKFRTLDGIDRELMGNDLMICDAENGLCIAGVFGGEHSGVGPATKNIFLESACFDAKHVRRTAKHHGLKTDASFRFERGTDPGITVYALQRAAMLICEICKGAVATGVADHYPMPVKPFTVDFTYAGCKRLAGKDLGQENIKKIISSLGISISAEKEGGLVLSVPPYKVDVKRECDVVEEIMRIYGYNNIEEPQQLRASLSFSVKPDREKVFGKIATLLSSTGFREIFTNSLSKSSYYENSTGKVTLLNPLSTELDAMRQTLLYNGLEVIAYNRNRKSPDLKVFEFGKVYVSDPSKKDSVKAYSEQEKLGIFMTGKDHPESWYDKQRNTDIYQLKSQVRNCFTALGLDVVFQASDNSYYHPGSSLRVMLGKTTVGHLGSVHPGILKKFDIADGVYFAELSWDIILDALKNRKSVFYREVPKFPAVRRDLAMILDKKITYAELETLAFETERKLLTKVDLFDVFEGDKIGRDKKSYAMSFLLQDMTATLTDQQVEKVMERLMNAYREKLGAEIRQ